MVSKNDKPNIVTVEMLKVSAESSEQVADALSVEEPLEIVLSGSADGADFKRVLAVTMRTPGNDDELALGLLLSEGIIVRREDVCDIKRCECNSIEIVLRPGLQVKFEDYDRHSVVNSSCGVCGKKSISSVMERAAFQIEGEVTVDSRVISQLPGALRLKQPAFDSTGGIHASALFDLDGRLIAVREDVGRHNALDKLIGSRLLARELPLSKHVLLLSGRASFELIQKAASAGIPIVAAVGAPSSLAVELAKSCNITLLGFVRNDRFNVYAGAQRIKIGVPSFV